MIEAEKDIGVTMDPKLKFDMHISNVVNKANRIMGVIRRTYQFLDMIVSPNCTRHWCAHI